MNASKTSIVIASLIAATSALAATSASAQKPDRLTDVAFIAASRCEGLAQGAKVDTTAIKSLLVNQDNARNSYILEKADQAREDAQRMASHAQGYSLQTVNNELNGACQAYLKS
jgi:hypothetical protein